MARSSHSNDSAAHPHLPPKKAERHIRSKLAAIVWAFALAPMTMASAAGCDWFEPPEAPQAGHNPYLTLRTQGSARIFRVEGTRVWGPDTDVERIKDEYLGRLHGHVLSFSTTGDQVRGMLGNGRTELHVKEDGPNLSVVGMYGSTLSELDVTPRSVKGNIGPCSYDLRRSESDPGWYEGRRACFGGGLANASLSLPKEWAERPKDDRAVMIAMLLGQ